MSWHSAESHAPSVCSQLTPRLQPEMQFTTLIVLFEVSAEIFHSACPVLTYISCLFVTLHKCTFERNRLERLKTGVLCTFYELQREHKYAAFFPR